MKLKRRLKKPWWKNYGILLPIRVSHFTYMVDFGVKLTNMTTRKMARDRRETAQVAAGLAPNSMREVDYLRKSYSSSKLSLQ